MTETALYTRPKSLKNMSMFYCPGCGHGIIHKLIAELIDEMDLRGRMVGIAPVGCSVTAYDYLDVDFSEAAHGRAPAVATGIKRARPDLFVLAYQGDGDLASIGMAEIIHAANRGENYTTIFVNNTIYGMTGGQLAPTTLPGQKTATCPEGRDPATMGEPIRVCELLNTLAAPALLARTMLDTPAGIRKTKRLLRRAFQCQLDGNGFSLVEVLSPCPVYMRMEPKEAMDYVRETVSGTFPIDVFRDRTAE
ncbi:MAG TPA: thiamine pyrophosphate-dependent enzyme [Phycisphaerae bacterium]|nr:thiamine pyrophosphate-dependent enzyme [Phycisphaerae bacterium]